MNDGTKLKENILDFISSIVLLLFSIFVFANGIYIIKTMKLGKGVEWYVSPALLPMFIGIVIGLLSVILISKTWKDALTFLKLKKLSKIDDKKFSVKELIINFNNNVYLRLALTLLLLIVYVFILIGKIPFPLATFIYLTSNMIIFRENNFAIWKILLISLAASFLIYYGFGVLAKIPLP